MKINSRNIGIGLIILAIICVIIGLALIGSVDHGFKMLEDNGIGKILNWGSAEKIILGDAIVDKLKVGCIFAVIITPISFGLGVFSLAFYGLKK